MGGGGRNFESKEAYPRGFPKADHLSWLLPLILTSDSQVFDSWNNSMDLENKFAASKFQVASHAQPSFESGYVSLNS